jgi:curli biogenesis system outer membrane secretion channel CsgG
MVVKNRQGSQDSLNEEAIVGRRQKRTADHSFVVYGRLIVSEDVQMKWVSGSLSRGEYFGISESRQ